MAGTGFLPSIAGEWGVLVREIVDAAVGFPTVPFTSALIVITGFWLLVLLGRAERDSFDSDVDADALGMGDLPVAAAASLVIALAWIFSLAGSVLLHRSEASGLPYAVLAVAVLAVSLTLAYVVARVTVRAWGRVRGIARSVDAASPTRPGPGRAGTGDSRSEP